MKALHDFFAHYDAAESTWLICTPNQRLARFLKTQYLHYRQAKLNQGSPAQNIVHTELEGSAATSLLSVQPLPVMALRTWQTMLLDHMALLDSAANLRIAPQHVRAIWQDILNANPADIDTGDVLDTAIEADTLLSQWALTEEAIATSFAKNDVLQLWQTWREQFEGILAKSHWLDDARALNALNERLASFSKSSSPAPAPAPSSTSTAQTLLPQQAIFVGFDQRPQPLTLFQRSLEAAGVAVEHRDFFVAEASAARLARFDTAKTELFAACEWAKQAVAKHRVGSQSPEAQSPETQPSENQHQVAIVVPDLAQRLPEVESALATVFEPEAILPGREPQAITYNISSGVPLAKTPLVQVALQLLGVQAPAGKSQPQPTAEFASLLRSPFISVESEYVARCDVYQRLQSQYLETSLFQIRATVAEVNAKATEVLLKLAEADLGAGQTASEVTERKPKPPLANFHARLDAVIELLGARSKSAAIGKKCLPSVWLTHWQQVLTAWGWPGSRTLSSTEYQQHQQWQEVLVSVRSFDTITGVVDHSRALQLLTQALNTPFHRQTPAAPVQVLGVLEAAGQLFDGLWWLGLDSHTWPEPLQPNGLLPKALQREQAMPRASASHELAYSRAVTERLLRSAQQVIVSCPYFRGDEPLTPSPLVAALPQLELPAPQVLHPWQYQPAPALEYYHDDAGLPLPIPSQVGGGTRVLKAQAQCAFKAYARERLKAFPAEVASPYWNGLDRGNLVHQVLEQFWTDVQNHQALWDMDSNTIEASIREMTQNVIVQLPRARQLGERAIHAEAERTVRWLCQWLETEKAREPFTIHALESPLDIELEGLQLTLRVDRIDCLADGKTLAVIDYKTSNVALKSWAWPRLEEPQLPLYASVIPGVGAAAFAVVRPQTLKYLGLTEAGHLFDQISQLGDAKNAAWPANFDGLMAEWQSDLQQLARDFMAGHAEVNPQGSACQFCDLQTLCRVAEQ